MFAGFLLILAVLILGGVIATLGDRIGTKIGKKRLSLFNLRPRYTATLVTICTGMMIAGVSMGLILLVSDRIRVALFTYDQLQADLSNASRQKEAAEGELNKAATQRVEAQRLLRLALTERTRAEANLSEINRELTEAKRQQATGQQKLIETQGQLKTLESQKQNLLKDEAALKTALQSLKGERRNLIATLNRSRVTLARLQRQQSWLAALIEKQGEDLNTYKTGIGILSSNVDNLRSGDVIFQSNQTVAMARVPGGLPLPKVQEIFDSLLSGIDLEARKAGARPEGGSGNAVLIYPTEVRRLLAQLAAPGTHAVQIFAVDNSLRGEPLWVQGRVVPNRLLFHEGEVIASRQFDETVLKKESELNKRLIELFGDANLQARRAGILTGRDAKVGEFSELDLQQLLSELKSKPTDDPITIQAISKQDVYTIGPLKLMLVAVQNGRVISRAG